MRFHVKDLEIRPAQYDVDLPAGELDYFDPKLQQAGALKATGKVELSAASIGEIRATGHVEVIMQAECDRCLEPGQYPVKCDFELYYRPAEASGSTRPGEEQEIDGGEAEIGFYDGDALDLKDVLREQVLLEVPMQRLCRKDCLGICPVCGENRNQTECGCDTSIVDDRWAALKRL